MIAVLVHSDVVLAGLSVPSHAMLEVVDEVDSFEHEGVRNVLSTGEARALVQAGYADAIEPDFERLSELIDAWQRA